MADIFISYSKKDAEQARLIAALLEAQGYSVWWDTSLLSGDQFRQVIMRELAAAKAVVVLWTENSVSSDWVQSEAGRAHSDHKLVPLKSRLLTYDLIPPPFDNLHTTNFDNHEAVLTAVEAQLAKPVAAPVVWKKLRYRLLYWTGIIGGALNIANFWQNFRALAYWMHGLVDNFTHYQLRFWSTLGYPFHIKISESLSSLLSGIGFYAILTVAPRYFGGSRLTDGLIFKRVGYSVLILLLLFVIYFGFVQSFLLKGGAWSQAYTMLYAYSIFMFVPPVLGSLFLADGTAKEKVAICILFEITFVMTFAAFFERGMFSIEVPLPSIWYLFIYYLFIYTIIALPLIFVQTEALVERLTFLIITVIAIFGLSEISRYIESHIPRGP